MISPRLQKLRKLMAEEKLYSVLISSLSNITYLSDFSGFTTEDRDAYLLITQKKQFIFTHPIYREVAEKDFKDFTLVEMRRNNPFSLALKNIIEKEKISSMGFEAFDLKVSDYERITKEINKKILKSVNLLGEIRVFKNSEEIQAIKKACQLGDKTFEFICKQIKLGITEIELALEIEYFIRKHGAGISFDPIVAFGPNASQPHHIPDRTKLKKNSFVLLDFGTKLNSYCSDMTRTVFFGKANTNQRKLYDAVLNAQKTSVEYLKKELKQNNSVLASKIDQVGRDYLTSLSISPFNHSSHGIGLNVHERPHLFPSSNDTMKNGMVFSIEPGTYEPGNHGIRIEDIFAIEDGKLIQLTKSSSNFIEI